MEKLLICLVIVVLIYYMLIKTINSTCIDTYEKIEFPKIICTRSSLSYLEKLTSDQTINVKFDITIPCGIYTGDSYYGIVTMIVGRQYNDRGVINFIDFGQSLDKFDRFEITNVKRISKTNNEYINTYNIGCCNKN